MTPRSLLLVALALASLTAWRQEGMFFRDGAVYLGLAKLVHEGHAATAVLHPHHPGTSWGIAAFWKVTGDPVVAGRLWSFLGLILTGAGLWMLVAAQWGRRAAGWSVFVAMTLPHVMIFGTDILSDPMSWGGTFLGAGLLWTGAQRRSWPRALGAGLAFGLAYLCRPEGLVMFGGAAVIFMVALLRRRTSWKLGVAFLVGFVVMASPYVGMLREHHGAWRLSLKTNFVQKAGLDRWLGKSSNGDEILKVPGLRPDNTVDAWGELTSTRERLAVLFDEQIGGLASTAGGALLLCLLGAGLWRREARRAWPLLALGGVQFLMIQQQWFDDHYLSKRHWMPVALVLAGLSGPVARYLLRTRRPLMKALALVMMLVAVERDLRVTQSRDKRRASLKVELRELGLQLRRHRAGHLVCQDGRTAWFAGKTHIDWPVNDDPVAFVERARRQLDGDLLVAVPSGCVHRDPTKTSDVLVTALTHLGWSPLLASSLETVLQPPESP